MKKILKYTVILSFLVSFVSCESERSLLDDLDSLGFQGTTEDIIDFLSQDAYNSLLNLGVTIYEGRTPPNIEGSFYMSPFVMAASNIQGDNIGQTFSDNVLNFSFQNNNDLSIFYEGYQISDGNVFGNETGLESFVSGSGNNFTVIVRVNRTNTGSSGTVVSTNGVVISGTKSSGGISNLSYSFVVISKTGDVNNEFINVGQGRRFTDGDNFSPQI